MAEMRRRGTCPEQELDYIEGDLNYNTGHYREALKFYGSALESARAADDDTLCMELLHRKISCYDALHDESAKTGSVEELMELAVRLGDKPMESIALFNMGKSLRYQGDSERGYRYMEQGAEMMAASDYRLKYDNLRYEYKTLVMFYERDGRYDDVLRILDAWEKVVSASTGEETAVDGLEESERKDLCAMRTVALSRLGRSAEAAQSYCEYRALGENLARNDYLIMPYLFDTGQYDEIFRINLPRERFLAEEGDTVNYYMASVLKFLGYACRDVGDYRRSSSYFERLAVLRDSLKYREQESAAQDYAALYDSREKDLQILREQEEQRTLRMVALGVCLLLVLVICHVLRTNRIIRRKNRSMSKTIDKLMAWKDEAYARQEEAMKMEEELRQIKGPEEKADAAAPGTKLSGRDRALYERVNYEIVSRKLYLKPDFSKKMLLKEIHIPEYKFAPLFQEFAGCSFTQYIQRLRLDHAVKLMQQHPQWSLEAVAKEAQMSKTSFYKQFQKEYGMRPSDYREKGLSSEHEG